MFFVYPLLSMPSIGLIAALSLLSALFFNRSGFIALIIQFIIWSLMVKYAFESLRSTAEGRFKPPPLSSEVLLENFSIVFKQIALYFVIGFVGIFITVKLGSSALPVYALTIGVTLPSILIILIVNDDLGQALNPFLVFGIIFRIGWAYFLLLFFILLLLSAPAALGYTVIQHMPLKLQQFLFTIANNYYTLIIYHMMGYVILQYHHRLNYPVALETILSSIYPDGPQKRDNDRNHARKIQHEDLLNDVSQLVQDGELDKAIGRIEKQVECETITDMELSKRYLGLLKLCKQESKLTAYAPHHLEILVKARSKSAALELYRECLKIDNAFAPQALVSFKIASWLSEAGKHQEAILALNAIIKKFPKDAIVPKAYYRAALIFHERLQKGDQAKKILNGLIKKFPDHEICAFARNYLAKL